MTAVPIIVAAVIVRDGRLLLVEAQGPDDPQPVWMLPGGRVEDAEEPMAALARELAEETGLRLAAEPRLAFSVEVDYHGPAGVGRYRALTYAAAASGRLRPRDPDGLVLRAAYVGVDEALRRLARVQWYECEPLRRFLAGDAAAGAAYRYGVVPRDGGLAIERFEAVDGGEPA